MNAEKSSFGKPFLSKKRFVEIAIVLCSVFLVALPAIAAEQNPEMHEMSASTITTASEDDYVLGVYGNANEDDTIDMRDLTYVKLIFFDEKPETEFADAKYDGEINPLDFVQIKLVIVGKEEELTIVDSAGRIVTIKKPIESIVCVHHSIAEALRIVGVWDKVVGWGLNQYLDSIIYSNFDELPIISAPMNCYDVNYEKLFELHPDIFLAPYNPMPGFDDMVANLEPEIPVVALELFVPDTIVENFRKLGLILGKEDEAEEFIEFYKKVEADISEVTSKIPEEDKPRRFFKTGWGDVADLWTYTDDLPGVPYRNEITGSINIAADLPSQGGWVHAVDPEWLIEQDPDFVIDGGSTPGTFGLGVGDTSAVEAMRNEIMKFDVFSGGTAVKNGDVYLIATSFFGAPKYIIGLAYQAKWFYPDLLQDLDPQAIHQEYLTRFMRIDYDLSQHGVFAYPEP